ncbi:hypothetical protein Hanom_Chr03g00237851 [Helianthus anomalus]
MDNISEVAKLSSTRAPIQSPLDLGPVVCCSVSVGIVLCQYLHTESPAACTPSLSFFLT